MSNPHIRNLNSGYGNSKEFDILAEGERVTLSIHSGGQNTSLAVVGQGAKHYAPTPRTLACREALKQYLEDELVRQGHDIKAWPNRITLRTEGSGSDMIFPNEIRAAVDSILERLTKRSPFTMRETDGYSGGILDYTPDTRVAKIMECGAKLEAALKGKNPLEAVRNIFFEGIAIASAASTASPDKAWVDSVGKGESRQSTKAASL